MGVYSDSEGVDYKAEPWRGRAERPTGRIGVPALAKTAVSVRRGTCLKGSSVPQRCPPSELKGADPRDGAAFEVLGTADISQVLCEY